MTTGLAVAALLAGLAAAPLASAQGEESRPPMIRGDMQGMMEMMRMMARRGPIMEACAKMMQAAADQLDTPATPPAEEEEEGWVPCPARRRFPTLVLAPILLLDNVLKPILMSRGLATPPLIILIGVVGGTITHGLIGPFLGPVVLAVLYDLLVAWVRLDPARTPDEPH